MARKSESLISSAFAASAAFFCAPCKCCSLSTFVIGVPGIGSDIDYLLYTAPFSPAFRWSRSYTSRYPAVAYRTLRRERLSLASPLASSSRERSRVCSLMAPASYREGGTRQSHRTLYNELKYEGVTRAGATSENSVKAKFAEFSFHALR